MPLRAPGLLLLFLAGIQSFTPQGQSAYRSIPFDTTLAVASTPTLSIDLETGGAIRIIGGDVQGRPRARQRTRATLHRLRGRGDALGDERAGEDASRHR